MRFCVYAPRVVFVPAFILLVVAFATVFASLIVPVDTVQATTPKLLYYQGKISVRSNGTNIADGNYSMQFKMYDAASAGTLLWTETWDGGTSQVAFVNGMFSVALGTYVALPSFTGGSVYLTVNFNSGSGYDGEMSPRQQITAAAYALVANSVAGDGDINTTNTSGSATALAVARSAGNYALQVDTSTVSAATGLKVTSAAAGGGVALSAISSGTNENLTIDAKGSGTITIGTASGSTGDILLGGGSASTGCTVTNSTGAFACTAGGSFTTLALTGAVTGAASYNGLVVTANTGVITTGTWNGTAINAGFINFNSTNLQNSSNALNTIQNINTSATPQFAGVGLGTTGSSTNLINATVAVSQTLISSSSSAITSNTYINLTQNTSTFTGTGLKLDFANISGTFSGSFVDFKNNTASKFTVSSGGVLSLAGAQTADITTVTAAAANALTIQPSAPSSTGAGGALNLKGGSATTTGAGGGLTILGGTGVSGAGGDVSINAGTGSSVGAINIGTTNAGNIIIGGSSTPAIKLGKFTTANTVLYVSATDGTLSATAASTGAQCLQTASAGVAPTWGSCGAGGATAFDVIGDPSGNGSIAMGTTAQTLDWGAITTTDALSVTSSGTGLTSGSVFKVTSATAGAVTNGIAQFVASANYSGAGGVLAAIANSTTAGTVARVSGTALTTGTGLSIVGGNAMTTGGGLDISGTYNHTGTETGSLAEITFSESTSNAVTSTTNGLLVSPTITMLGGAATRTVNGISVNPSFTSCPAGTCTVNGINIANVTDGTGFTGTGLKIGTGWDTGLSIATSGAVTGLSVAASGAPTQDMVNITNSGQAVTTGGVNALSINYTGGSAAVEAAAMRVDLTPGGTAAGIWSGLRIVTGATAAAAVTENGIKVETATAGSTSTINAFFAANVTGGAGTEIGYRVGTGYDYGLQFDDTTPAIRLGATDDTAALGFYDNCSSSCTNGGTTPNKLVEIRDLSTNFGASVIAGAFIDTTSTIREEFNRQRTSATADTTGAQNAGFGNGGGWGVYEGGTTPNCTFSSLADSINGITRMAASGVASGCLMMVDEAINNPKLLYNVSNRPVILIKVKPGQADTNSAIYAGMATETDGQVTAPANFIGFSNDNAGTLGTTWVGITRSASTSTTVVCTGQTVSTSQYALLMVEVRSSTSVRFWIDNNASDGINFTECGSGSSTNIYGSNLAPELMWQERTGGSATNSQLDIDFYRSWQDDAQDGLSLSQDGSEVELSQLPQLDFGVNGEALRQYNSEDLAAWFNGAEEISSQSTIMQISSDRVVAGLEMVAPNISGRGLKIDRISSLGASVQLISDVEFIGRPYFNSDTAGFAQISQGDKEVTITFDKEYLDNPIVNATLSLGGKLNDSNADSAQEALVQSLFDQGLQYAVIKRTAKGFAIVLNKPAPENLEFSWTAFAVKNPKIFRSIPTAGNTSSASASSESSGSEQNDSNPTNSSDPAQTSAVESTDSTDNSIVPST